MRGPLLVLLVMLVAAMEIAAEGLVVVVHPTRGGTLAVEEIARIYLKQQRFWAGGDPIVPINREARSATRRSFDASVFGSRAGSLADYWNRQYFRGVLPPATLASDQAVLRFVANEPRAIAYLPASLADDSVHVAAHFPAPPQAQSTRGRRGRFADHEVGVSWPYEFPGRDARAEGRRRNAVSQPRLLHARRAASRQRYALS